MTPDEKALIDAKREGWIAKCRSASTQYERNVYGEDAWQRAAEVAFPYPPPPVVWREAKDGNGNRYRRRDGVWEYQVSGGTQWYSCGAVSDEWALALARCVTEPTVQEGEG